MKIPGIFVALAWVWGCTGEVVPGGASEGGGASNVGGSAGNGGAATGPASALPAMRRLTFAQYRNTVREVFGAPLPELVLEREPAVHGFASVGASTVVTSPLGVERYEAAALAIAAQVFGDAPRRAALVGCSPMSATDAICTRDFLTRLGRKLYRRPLTSQEIERAATLATGVAAASGDFWKGAEAAVAALLMSPKFLYRAELGEPSSDGARRFKSYDAAARLAFFLWNSSPDQELLDATERGELGSLTGLRAQAGRLLAWPTARAGFRGFFQEALRIDESGVAEGTVPLQLSLLSAIHEQAWLTFEDALFNRGETFGQLVRTPITFLNDELALHYGLAVPNSTTLTRVTLPAAQPRLGILGLASILIKQSNQPHTSPTGRGKFVREALLCQTIPSPPPGVVTELPSIPEGTRISMRDRLDVHRSQPQCAACHALTDPIGLGLENFDSLGRFRAQEQGLDIEAAGDLDGIPFANAGELGAAVSQHPDLARCFALQLARYLTGVAEPGAALDPVAERYSTQGGSFEQLLMSTIESELFNQASSAMGVEQ